jgi:hypothetical protein
MNANVVKAESNIQDYQEKLKEGNQEITVKHTENDASLSGSISLHDTKTSGDDVPTIGEGFNI